MPRNKTLSFPVAYCLDSLKIEHISKVQNGKNCNCICLVCSEPLIAKNNVNNIKEAHFSHKPESDCETNVETYLHLVIKEILPELNKVNLPSDNVYISDFLNLEPISEIYKSQYLAKTLKEIEVYKESKEIEFTADEVRIEKTYKIDDDKIRPDIVICRNGVELFIEPHVTNKISYDKLNKIKKLDISCVAINLQLFLSEYGQLFTLEELKSFIISDLNSKSWVWLRNAKRKSTTQTIVNRINKKLKDYPNFVDWDKSKTLSLSSDKQKLENIDNEIENLKKKKLEIQRKFNETLSSFETKERELLAAIEDLLKYGRI
ncbi:hypothetical protein GYB57_15110 [bacterium]|nr:hypothetical protein [bacterium]